MSDIERMTDYVCDPYFGLTKNEAKLLRYAMQGIIYRPDLTLGRPSDLAASVMDACDSVIAIQEDAGLDPSDPNAPADRRFEYSDLAEKLHAMDPEKASHLYFFMVGYLAAWEMDDA